MPDHEEAVREARERVVTWLLPLVQPSELVLNAVADLESAIRANERAKYAALVEAAVEVVRVSTPEHFETNRSVSALHRALTALQKEALNELQA